MNTRKTVTVTLLIASLFAFSGCKLVDTAKETYGAIVKKFKSDTLPTQTIVLKTKQAEITMLVETADDVDEREQGLMERTQLEEGKGMIFIYEDEAPRAFWMKNTKIPLDVIFFSSKHEVVSIVPTMTPCNVAQCPSYGSTEPAMYALEVPAGWTNTRGVAVGDRFDFKE
ncbi:DUF192 domain-containing protein [Candidatus Gracilibacteria bacterium]|nr:DUF192 domain-containing protein [Candidatus Gracilibacteria bacterium]